MTKKIIAKQKKETLTQEGHKRREFFTHVAEHALAGVAVSVAGAGILTVRHLVQDAPARSHRSLLRRIVDIDHSVQIFAGNTNKLAALSGKSGRSPYLRLSAERFTTLIASATGKSVFEVADDDIRLKMQLRGNEIVLLGGPVSNNVSAVLTCHGFTQVTNKGVAVNLPYFDKDKARNAGLRWGFFCGDTDYGYLAGEAMRANRYDGGELVERPLYGLWDVQSDAKPEMFAKQPNGLLSEEALLISRIRNPYDSSRGVLTMGGVHGYSTLEFCKDIEGNLERLQDLCGGAKFFQAMVPVGLKHDQSASETLGHLRWDEAAISIISRV